MEARAWRLVLGAAALRVGDGAAGDVHGIEVNSCQRGGRTSDKAQRISFHPHPDDGSWFSDFCLSHRC